MKLLIKNITLIIFDDNSDGKYPSEIFNVISDLMTIAMENIRLKFSM